MSHRSTEELIAGLEHVRTAPRGAGRLDKIVRRPATGDREELESAVLDVGVGLVGDNWRERPSIRTADGSPHPEMQITLMNSRAANLIAISDDRWALAGDQLYVDLDLSEDHLPAGTRLAIGDAVLQVSAQPHTGCAKFTERFGLDAMRFVNSEDGKQLHLRGINTWVLTGGTITVGDMISTL